MIKTVCVRAPATSANVGCGFDCLGFALTLYNEISFSLSDKTSFFGCDEKYANKENLAYKGMETVYRRCGLKMPEFTIRINTNIPIARGLGSSAAMLACGGVAANAFCGEKLSKAELLSVLTEIEGHPDNLAPALYGGFTAAACEENKIFVTQHPVSEKLLFTALIPPFEVSTEKARAVLPSEIPFSDAVKQLSHIPFLLEAMKTGNGVLLKIALLNRLH